MKGRKSLESDSAQGILDRIAPDYASKAREARETIYAALGNEYIKGTRAQAKAFEKQVRAYHAAGEALDAIVQGLSHETYSILKITRKPLTRGNKERKSPLRQVPDNLPQVTNYQINGNGTPAGYIGLTDAARFWKDFEKNKYDKGNQPTLSAYQFRIRYRIQQGRLLSQRIGNHTYVFGESIKKVIGEGVDERKSMNGREQAVQKSGGSIVRTTPKSISNPQNNLSFDRFVEFREKGWTHQRIGRQFGLKPQIVRGFEGAFKRYRS